MSLSQYNRIYNFSLAVVVLFNIICLADLFLKSVDISGIISKASLVFIVYSFGMLGYKIHLTRKYFLGRDVIYNLIAHAVLTVSGIVFILIAAF